MHLTGPNWRRSEFLSFQKYHAPSRLIRTGTNLVHVDATGNLFTEIIGTVPMRGLIEFSVGIRILASEAEGVDEEDPRAAAQLMRKLSDMTGIEYGENMQEALRRLEAGEDPDAIEAEMGDLLEGDEDPFIMPGKKGGKGRRKLPPERDDTLYEM